MSEDILLVDIIGAVARLTLNRPKAMNALSTPLVGALDDALKRIAQDPAICAVILTGTGSTFCAGADLKEAKSRVPTPGEPDFIDLANEMMSRLRSLPKPVIVALNGLTMAGGLELAMCGDILLAADTATIGDAHAKFGVFPGAGGAAVLPRLVPLPTALYMLLTGRNLPAKRLYDVGFIAEIYPAEQLGDAALALAQELAEKSPSSLRRMKAVARAAADKTREDAMLHERVMLQGHMASEDFQEGLRAFAEKRAPRFTGR
jgi:enoyl-CoA hydratase/carnithine racemase